VVQPLKIMVVLTRSRTGAVVELEGNEEGEVTRVEGLALAKVVPEVAVHISPFDVTTHFGIDCKALERRRRMQGLRKHLYCFR